MADIASSIRGPRRARSTYRRPAVVDGLDARVPAGAVALEWRQLNRRLWVARSGGDHVGMVEHGRRFTAIDRENTVRGRYGTLLEAQSALAAAGSGCA